MSSDRSQIPTELPPSEQLANKDKIASIDYDSVVEQSTVNKVLSGFLDKRIGTASSYEQYVVQEAEQAAPSIQEQISKGVEALQKIDGIKPEVWERLGLEERLEVLQTVENHMATVQGRPPANVVIRKKGGFGAYATKSNTIFIKEKFLASNDVAEQVDVTIHEGRHAYQQYAVRHSGFHANEAEVSEWRTNLNVGGNNYKRIQVHGFRAYRSQPVEYDAWAYAYTFRQLLYS